MFCREFFYSELKESSFINSKVKFIMLDSMKTYIQQPKISTLLNAKLLTHFFLQASMCTGHLVMEACYKSGYNMDKELTTCMQVLDPDKKDYRSDLMRERHL